MFSHLCKHLAARPWLRLHNVGTNDVRLCAFYNDRVAELELNYRSCDDTGVSLISAIFLRVKRGALKRS